MADDDDVFAAALIITCSNRYQDVKGSGRV